MKKKIINKYNLIIFLCFIIIIGGLILLFASQKYILDNTILSTPPIEIEVETTNTNNLKQEIYNLTNQERIKNNQQQLSYNNKLDAAADQRAMEAATSFSHIRPNGKEYYTIINIQYQYAGENLLLISNEAATGYNIVESWMNSPSHKENILRDTFSSIAIGIYVKDDITYISQIFIG